MRSLSGLIRRHIREWFHLRATLIVLVFLTLAVVVNAYLDIEDHYIDQVWAGSPVRLLWYFLLFAIPYYFACYVLHLYGLVDNALSSKRFYLYSLFILLVIAFDSTFDWHHQLIQELAAPGLAYWVRKCSNNLKSLLTVILPLSIFYLVSRDKSRFYGLGKGTAHWYNYLLLLLFMVPLVAGASFTEGFQEVYPRYAPLFKTWIPGWVRVGVYELTYAFDFVTTELMFRGFLVIGMVRLLGSQAILPMAAVYCFYHFGKPPLEAFSSIFGGYLLGILAYSSRSIIGGILLHVGLAWMMELAAWLQK